MNIDDATVQLIDNWYRDGERAGQRNAEHWQESIVGECPYEAGSYADLWWRRGYDAGWRYGLAQVGVKLQEEYRKQESQRDQELKMKIQDLRRQHGIDE